MTTLNPEQHLAATTLTGPVAIIAGAGSGKTKTLIERIDNLVESGVAAHNILAITFTNKAANELKERLSLKSKSVHASTIHSLCVTLLREFQKGPSGEIVPFTIMDPDDQRSLISGIFDDICEVYKQHGRPIFPEGVTPNKTMHIRVFLNNISSAKNDNVWPSEYLNSKSTRNHKMRELTSTVYKRYYDQTRKINAYDFDDLLMETYKLLRTNNIVLNSVQNHYRHIMVDEYQDTNTLQNDLINQIASKYQNICVVGDPDQSIYGWRGAQIKNILNFEHTYPKAKVIYLNKNYRSSQNILDAANDVIANNDTDDFGRHELHSTITNVAPIRKVELASAEDEAEYIVNDIKTRHASGTDYADMVILYRTHALNREIEHALQINKIPYKISGGLSFYDRAEIKDVIAYLNVLANFTYDPSLRRIINVPSRGIGLQTLEHLSNWAKNQPIPQPLLSAVLSVESISEIPSPKQQTLTAFANVYKNALTHNDSITDLIKYFITNFDYQNYLAQDENAEERINNVNELLSDAKRFDAAHVPLTREVLSQFANGLDPDQLKKQDTLSRLTEFLATVAMNREISATNAAALEAETGVSLMTVHTAKGLEFKSVYVIGGEDGIFPSAQSLNALSRNDSALDEERRLMYVAITRAKEYLTLTTVNARFLYGNVQHNGPSRFFNEFKPNRVHHLKIPAMHPPKYLGSNENPWS